MSAADMDTEILRLLRSPLPPSDMERDQIKELLEISEGDIQRLTRSIDALLVQRKQIVQKIASYNAILSPMRGLPRDVLQEIFSHCVPSKTAMPMKTSSAPLLLCRICSSWREVALATSEIWSSISIVLPFHARPTKKDRLIYENAQAWLGRSGRHPLTISIEFKCDLFQSDQEENPLASEMLKWLIQYAPRWKRITVISPIGWIQDLADIPKSQCEMLRRFSFRHSGLPTRADADQPPFWERMQLLSAPKLHYLSLSHRLSDLAPAFRSMVSLENLTHLNLVGWIGGSADAYEVLSRCVNIWSCTISVSDNPTLNIPFTVSDPATLPNLSSLTFIESRHRSTRSEILFSNLLTPHLTSFRYQSTGHTTAPWVALVERCKLKELAFELSNFHDNERLLTYLQTASSIKKLTVYPVGHRTQPISENDAIMHLIPTADKVLCPSLKTLSLQCHSHTFLETGFVALVKARAALVDENGKKHFKGVSAYFARELDVEVLEQLRPVIENGTSIQVTHQGGYWPDKTSVDRNFDFGLLWSVVV